MQWSANQYRRFEDERTRPAADLVAAIPRESASVAIDLGCGPGNSTEVLANRYPMASISGPEMVCVNATVVYRTVEGFAQSYRWTLEGVGAIVGPADRSSLTVKWGSEGSGTLRLEVVDTRTGCRTVVERSVTIGTELKPVIAILDPELTVSMPPRVTAATGFDALTHGIEAYLSNGDHPMADAIALGCIELCAKHLPRAVEAGADLVARGAMMKAAMMGAVAFQKGLGVCHSLAHPLSSEKNMHHGLANALCLPAVVDFNNAVVPERVERVRRILDLTATSLSNAIRGLREKIGLPSGLAAEGVGKSDIAKLADKAMEDACHRSNPRPCERTDMVKLYELSL